MVIMTNQGAGKDRTPESKKSGRRTIPVNTPSDRINLDSTPGFGQDTSIPGYKGEQNRNLNGTRCKKPHNRTKDVI